jgi:hypothetical protein
MTPAKQAEIDRKMTATDFEYIDRLMGGSDG